MRPGEMVILRPMDFQIQGKVWFYTPGSEHEFGRHKLEHQERGKVVVIGPKAIEAITYLDIDTHHQILSPRVAMEERNATKKSHRRMNQKPNPATTGRKVGDEYTPGTFYNVIRRICDKHNIPHWKPQQLRHNVATLVEGQYGLEEAQAVLGHARADTTQIYTERQLELAAKVAERVG